MHFFQSDWEWPYKYFAFLTPKERDDNFKAKHWI